MGFNPLNTTETVKPPKFYTRRDKTRTAQLVMPGFSPGIHEFCARIKDAGGRDKPGRDVTLFDW